jgi:hypothetical protein
MSAQNGKSGRTNKNAEVGSNKMQRRDMRKICHDTSDARQDSCEADHGMERSNGLRQVCWGDSLSNEETCSRVK